MGLFFNPRKNKTKWASIVMAGNTSDVDEKTLDAATELYIKQHARIMYESIHLFLTSKNKETRKSRHKLATQHLGALCGVRRFATKKQQKAIDRAYDDFHIAEDKYKHPNKEAAIAKANARQQNKNDFWETYAMFEMIDIFCGDKK